MNKQTSQIQTPLLSIITPAHNAEVHLEASIKSVLTQKNRTIEYLIIDGASTDDTLAIIKKYETQIDYWISEPDKGIYDAMNKGIQASRGEWLYFLGADDRLVADVLTKIYTHLKLSNQLLVYGYTYDVRAKRNVGKAHDIISLSLPGQRLPHQACFYHRSLFQHLGDYNQAYALCADHVFNLNCVAAFADKIKFLPLKICNYGGNGISYNRIDRNYYQQLLEINYQVKNRLPSNSPYPVLLDQNFQLLIAEKEIIFGNYWKGFWQTLKFSFDRKNLFVLLKALNTIRKRLLNHFEFTQ